MTRRVAVVGAGYAGLSAAIALARAGLAVTLFEANRVAGGRARRVEYRGALLDNGQHLLLGAYRETLALMREVGVAQRALRRFPLTLVFPGHFSLAAPAQIGTVTVKVDASQNNVTCVTGTVTGAYTGSDLQMQLTLGAPAAGTCK